MSQSCWHRGFEGRLRVSISASASRRDEIPQQLQQLAGSLGHFNSPRTAAFQFLPPHTSRRLGPKFLLSTEEVASIFHAPNQTVQAPTLARVESREFAPPALPAQGDLADVVARRGVKSSFAMAQERRIPAEAR